MAIDQACPSAAIVDLLLRAFPESASSRRGVGRLALHYAFFSSNTNEAIVHNLLRVYKEGASISDIYGRLPIHYAVDRAHPQVNCIDMLNEAYPKGISSLDLQGKLPLDVYVERAKGVRENILKRLLELYPEAVKLKRSSTTRHILHTVVDHAKPNLACVRLVSRLYPQALRIPSSSDANYTPIQIAQNRGNSFVLREMLLADPTFDPSLLRELNWKFRRDIIMISFYYRDIDAIIHVKVNVSDTSIEYLNPLMNLFLLNLFSLNLFLKVIDSDDEDDDFDDDFDIFGDDRSQSSPTSCKALKFEPYTSKRKWNLKRDKDNIFTKLLSENLDIWKKVIMYL